VLLEEHDLTTLLRIVSEAVERHRWPLHAYSL